MKYLLLSLILIAIASRYAFAATTCFGFDQNDPRVCSGNGSCTGNDTCICSSGFNGSACENYACGGIHFNDSNVCSGRGACIDLNNCMCQAPFTGVVCENFMCFGIPNKAPNVCNGVGTCSAPNNCQCSQGYTGPECKSFTCGGKPSNATDVCSNKGTCVGPDLCQCQAPFTGNDCQSFNCFGIDKNSAAVCNGKGTCGAPNNCTCTSGFGGPSCNLVTCNGQIFDASTTKASYSGNGREIIISFNLPIVQAARDLCAAGLSNVVAAPTIAKLTTSTCSFNSASEMKITLAANTTISVGNLIAYVPNTMKVEGCAVVFNGHPLQFPLNPIPISAQIKGPNVIANCAGSKIILDAGLSTGGGSLRYKWSLVGISSPLNTRLQGLFPTTNKVLINFSEITTTNTPFMLQIFDNFFRNSTVIFNVAKSANSNAPTAVITGLFQGDKLPRNLAGGLGVTATKSNCTSPLLKLSYIWSSSPALYIQSNKTSSVIIPAFQTTPGTQYTITCQAQLRNGATFAVETVVQYKFTATAGPLKVVLAGQKQQVLKNNGALVLDASASKDLNNKNGVPSVNQTYIYNCCQELGGQCVVAGCQAKFPGMSSISNGNKFMLSGAGNNTLPLGVFRFTVSMLSSSQALGSRSAEASNRIQIVPSGSPIVNTMFTQQGCQRGIISVTTANFGGNKVDFTYKVTSGSVVFLSNVTNTVAKSALFFVDISNTVTETNIDFTATWANQTAVGTATISPAQRPSGGSIEIQDLSGNAAGGNLKADTFYNLVVSGWSTTNNDAVSNTATLTFTAGTVKTVLSFSRSSTTRPFKTPLNIKSASVGRVAVVLETAQACSRTIRAFDFGVVDKFTLPSGVSLIDLAKQQEAGLKSAIANGSPSDVQNAVSGILNVLQQSSGGNATERAILKAQALDSYRNSILSDTAPVTAESRSAGLDILRSSATVVAEITASGRTAAVAVLKKLFAAPTANDEGIDTTTADSAFLTVGSLFDSINFVPVANKTVALLSLDDLLQTSIADFQNLQGVAKNVALQAIVLKGLGEAYHSVSSSFNISVYKNSGTAYPSTFSPFKVDGSMLITKTPVISNGPAVIDTLFARYPKAFYKSVGNYARMTSDAYTIEIIDDSTKLPANVVTANSPIEFRLKAASTAGATNACTFYNTNSGNFEPVTFVSAVTGVSVDCSSTHLTDFAAFNVDVPVPPTTVPPTTKPPTASSAVSVSSGKLFLIAVVLIVGNMF